MASLLHSRIKGAGNDFSTLYVMYTVNKWLRLGLGQVLLMVMIMCVCVCMAAHVYVCDHKSIFSLFYVLLYREMCF